MLPFFLNSSACLTSSLLMSASFCSIRPFRHGSVSSDVSCFLLGFSADAGMFPLNNNNNNKDQMFQFVSKFGVRRRTMSALYGITSFFFSICENSPSSVKSIFLLRFLPRLGFIGHPTFRLTSGSWLAALVSVTTRWGWGWTCCSDPIGWRKPRGFPTAAAAGSPFWTPPAARRRTETLKGKSEGRTPWKRRQAKGKKNASAVFTVQDFLGVLCVALRVVCNAARGLQVAQHDVAALIVGLPELRPLCRGEGTLHQREEGQQDGDADGGRRRRCGRTEVRGQCLLLFKSSQRHRSTTSGWLASDWLLIDRSELSTCALVQVLEERLEGFLVADGRLSVVPS